MASDVVRNRKSEGTTIGVVGRVRRRISGICRSAVSWIVYFLLHDPDVETIDDGRRFESGDGKTDDGIGRHHIDSKIRLEIDIATGEGGSSSTSSRQGDPERNSAALATSKIQHQVGKQTPQPIDAQELDRRIDDGVAWPEADRPLPSAIRTRSRRRNLTTRRRLSTNGHVQKISAETPASCPLYKTQPSTKSSEASPPSTNVDQVSVQVEDAVFSLNRNPLDEESRFFKKLSSTNNQKIVIKGIGVDAFCHALRWIYSREVRLTESNVLRVLDAAIGLEMEELAHECRVFAKDVKVNATSERRVASLHERI